MELVSQQRKLKSVTATVDRDLINRYHNHLDWLSASVFFQQAPQEARGHKLVLP